jgi:hypothetical protein
MNFEIGDGYREMDSCQMRFLKKFTMKPSQYPLCERLMKIIVGIAN